MIDIDTSAILPAGPTPGVAVCPWDGQDPVTEAGLALDLLAEVRPQTVIVHGHHEELLKDDAGARAAATVRREARSPTNPGRRSYPEPDVWIQIAGDYRPSEARQRWPSVAALAASCDAGALVVNAEDYWFTRPNEEALEALAACRAAAPQLAIGHTSFDFPTWVRGFGGGHGEYPWRGFCGPQAADWSLPQVYPAGDKREAAPGVGLRRLRYARTSWAQAAEQGLFRPDVVGGLYLQPYHVPLADTCRMAEAAPGPCVAFWAALHLVDQRGRQAMAALAELYRRGYWGPGSIEHYQADAGLQVDGIVGPLTLGALGLLT